MATCCNGATYRCLERVARIISQLAVSGNSSGLLIPAKWERSLLYWLPPTAYTLPSPLHFSVVIIPRIRAYFAFLNCCILRIFMTSKTFALTLPPSPLSQVDTKPLTYHLIPYTPPIIALPSLAACSWAWRPNQLSLCRPKERERERRGERDPSLIIIKIHIVHILDMKEKQEVPSAASWVCESTFWWL